MARGKGGELAGLRDHAFVGVDTDAAVPELTQAGEIATGAARDIQDRREALHRHDAREERDLGGRLRRVDAAERLAPLG